MDLYTATSYELAETLTKRYSTSFSMSSRLFDVSIRKHIYAIYGMVRIADEIVDSFRGDDAAARLTQFYQELKDALSSEYSTNPILHAFANTARMFSIDISLIEPFFQSMRADLTKRTFTREEYDSYIYGSAEVVGLMCLRVFVKGDDAQFKKLKNGASRLGAAYQKVNFLRDFADDYSTLSRIYFPGIKYETFTETDKQAIIDDIRRDFSIARQAIGLLPDNSRKAVQMSYAYYSTLLDKLEKSSPDTIKKQRIRVPDLQKIIILSKAYLWK